MKRTDITELFPDATEEQISKIMNLNGADINKAKGDLDGLKSQLQSANDELTKLKNAPNKDAELAALQKELDGMKAAETIRTMREKVSADKKIPASLLTGETEEACAAQADAILSFAQSSGYPVVHDGGEANSNHMPVDKVSAGYAKLADSLFGEK